MTEKEIRKLLFSLCDEKYRKFNARLIPTVPEDRMIGVRTPALRRVADDIIKVAGENEFLSVLPHTYYEENNIHAIIIGKTKNPAVCLSRINSFLPYLDNWATCDILRPKVLCKDTDQFLSSINGWIRSGKCFTVRFGMEMLMTYFLDDKYDISQSELVASADCREYYVSMMAAWYFATALAKQYDKALPFLEKRKLDAITHNRTISKACESFRISAGQKEYLRTLRILLPKEGQTV